MFRRQVILSNAMNERIHSNVSKLGAPFHKVYTAQNDGAYKPRLAAFERHAGPAGLRAGRRPARIGQPAPALVGL
jgi:FMN phosphatase YigB (HAD superfamily)